MAASIDIETETGTYNGPGHVRDSWGFDLPWWARGYLAETETCCAGWDM
jgi:hypothetical protein